MSIKESRQTPSSTKFLDLEPGARSSNLRCNLAPLFFTVLSFHLCDIVRATLTTADEHESGNSFAEAADRRYCVLRS